MRKRFPDLGCREVYENFTVKTLAGDEILMKDATVWQLLNLPIDDAIDLFENLLDVCRDADESVTFDYLFGLVKDQTRPWKSSALLTSSTLTRLTMRRVAWHLTVEDGLFLDQDTTAGLNIN